jgi:hypothetical protein
MEEAHIVKQIPPDYDQPISHFAAISNVWIKMMTFKKVGDYNPGHKHVFDHPTLLAQGSVEVEVEGEVTKFTAPAIIFIAKGKVHTIKSLEPNTVACCIHALRDGDQVGDIVSEDMLPKGIDPRTLFSDFDLPLLVEKHFE